jgi:SAM-dependent methyltransferase
MDPDGVIIRYLDSVLPTGTVLDIGAGDGFTAARLSANGRSVVALEPAHGMIEPSRILPWARGLAQQLPFGDACFDGCYATFAYFFSSIGHGPEGLAEVDRVLRPGGPFVFVDAAGNDELNALRNPADVYKGRDISSPRDWWHARGFRSIVLPTSFKFETIDEARKLLGFFYGDIGRQHANLEVTFNAIAYVRRVGPPESKPNRLG